MDGTKAISISIPQSLLDQAELLAQTLKLSPSELFERALTDFVQRQQEATPLDESRRESKRINQGDLFWIALEASGDGHTAIPHPYVVVQENLFNHSRIDMVVVCALTSNIRRESDTPGNVLLERGEANLPKQSVVEVSKVSAVPKAQLGEYIGSLSEPRVTQILAGMRFLQTSYFDR
jgi:mRNA interferase MazF